MKKELLSLSNTILIGTLLSFSSCNSGTSPDVSSIAKDSVTIAKGQNSFANKCNSCHNFNRDRSAIGRGYIGKFCRMD